ncbi:hypothetical protein [uncultured Cohaesibacter sp.]|uniref:hypothetical protein n=1 Tax=uncultured Cohaesibacter sp. TaxID=1002546 RepID=UPI0029C81D8E|nr:hypothetical protein [uncultured Cohaesibacter sp.]
MSGLKVVPAHYSPAGSTPRFQLLLTDGRDQAQRIESASETQVVAAPVPAALQYAASQQAYIQAQILSSEFNRTPRRYSAVRNAREAARAYGQARRRPQAVADMPVQRSVV